MKKFSIIKESINLDRFIISDSEFNQYKSKINNILKSELYSDNLDQVEGLTLVKALPYEVNQGRTFSVLNKVNTNILLLKKMVTMFGLNNFQDIISFVENNKIELFTQNGQYFESLVYKTIRHTEKIGEDNEDFVCNYLKFLAKQKYGQDITPVREVTSSYNDLILGIDITFQINKIDYTCQVKPLKEVRQKGDSIIITSSGRIKNYNTNYIAFANKSENKILLFRNKDVQVDMDKVIINRNNLVNI